MERYSPVLAKSLQVPDLYIPESILSRVLKHRYFFPCLEMTEWWQAFAFGNERMHRGPHLCWNHPPCFDGETTCKVQMLLALDRCTWGPKYFCAAFNFQLFSWPENCNYIVRQSAQDQPVVWFILILPDEKPLTEKCCLPKLRICKLPLCAAYDVKQTIHFCFRWQAGSIESCPLCFPTNTRQFLEPPGFGETLNLNMWNMLFYQKWQNIFKCKCIRVHLTVT